MPWNADHRHLALVGIAASAMVPDARALASVDAFQGQSAAVFELPGHGFSGADALAGAERVRFAAVAGVQLDSTIVASRYYDVSIAAGDPDFFTLSYLGAPLVLRDDGVGLPYVIENIIPKLDLIMAGVTSEVVSQAKAYKAPWTTPPSWAPLLIARLAAPTVCKVLRVASSRFEVPDVAADYDRAMVQFADLKNGVPMDDGTGPIDADDIPNDAAIATNSIAQGVVCDTQWLTGFL